MVSALSPSTRFSQIQSGEGSSPNGKQESYALAAVDALLKNTGQWQRWQQIRQQNDERARTLAAQILERNSLMQKAREGRPVSWEHFDALTARLSKDGIHLWDQSALLASGWRPGQPQAFDRGVDALPPPLKSNASPFNALSHEQQGGLGSSGEGRGAAFPSEKAEARGAFLPGLSSDTQKPNTRPLSPGLSPLISSLSSPVSEKPEALVLHVNWDRYILASGLGAYGSRDQVFLPLGGMASLLEIPIRVDASQGYAEGRVQGKAFYLDVNQRNLRMDGQPIAFSETALVTDGEDIHVDARILKDWLPVDFDFDYAEMAVTLSPREKLPFQERMERRQHWGRFLSQRSGMGPSVMEEKTPPASTSLPAMDLSLSASHNSQENIPSQAGYTLSGAGNLADGSLHFFARGNEGHTLRRLETRFEKTDTRGSGPLAATRFALGDVASPSLPILGRSGNEQGVLLENRSLFQERDFDSTRFEGNLAPGWEVELYRGHTLMDARTVGEDGRYLFDEVDLYYGSNDFRLVFYGPEGQKREETRRMDVGSAMLPKGEFGYAASLTRQDTITYAEDEDGIPDKGKVRAVGVMEYGLGERVTLSGGFATDTRMDDRRTRIHGGLETALPGASLRLDGIQGLEGGSALRLSGQTGLGDTRIRASQEFQDRLEGHRVANPVRSVTELSLFGALGTEKGFRVPYTLSGRYTDRDHGYESRLHLLNSLRTGPVYWTHGLTHIQNSGNSNPDTLQGSLNASTRFQDLYLRGHGNYRLDGQEQGLTQAGLTASKNIGNNLEIQGNLQKAFTDESRTSLDAQLNWRRESMSISPKISVDDGGDWSASLSMNMALGPDPHKGGMRPLPLNASHQGHAAVRVSEASDTKGGQEGKGLAGVRVRAPQAGVSAVTDQDGIALLLLSPHKKTDILIDEESLEDPALFPLNSGEAITPKPGEVRPFAFPVIRTGEIDGVLYGENAAGESLPLRQAEVFLKNDKGEIVDRVLSEYDGFYLFERVPPGEYRVEAVLRGEDGREIRRDQPVRVDASGSIESGRDFVLTRTQEPEEWVLFNEGKWTEPAQGENRRSVRPVFEENEVLLYQRGKWFSDVSQKDPEAQRDLLTETEILFEATKAPPSSLLRGPESWISEDLPGRGMMENEDVVVEERVLFEAKTASPVSGSGRKGGLGVHAGSYQSRERALLGIAWARRQMPELASLEEARIQPVDLGEKGRWYRVILGDFENREDAERIAAQMAKKTGYGRVFPAAVEGEISVHLASFAKGRDAEAGIRHLEQRFRSLLGEELAMAISKDSTGYRVLVQNFKEKEGAERFRDAVAAEGGYARVLE
ncbi:SPOR domain-containing protein [Desulfobotulus sp.]|uniref:SPOR domain-containing protein n=1 Tax=Desulfobotulus sp. TaxID=1940337 RepID=UPI002A35AD4F|nr:SPOR domain-containing protein [Desulfobotulus sp.]MDY0163239.1 SPOR domain-containing protein [Desulfobotulus sp.]